MTGTMAICICVRHLKPRSLVLLSSIYRVWSDYGLLLVLKRGPALWIERPESQDRPIAEQIVLDREEPDLVYGGLYVAGMRMAPVLAPALAGVALLLLMITRRRPSGKRD